MITELVNKYGAIAVSPNDLKRIPYNSGGVYFLCSENEIIYIGCSFRVHDRIMEHRCRRKRCFDTVYYIPCGKNLSIERFFINNYRPKLNIVGVKTRIAASLHIDPRDLLTR